MSVVLYRDGNTHIINGVKCEMMLVAPESFTMAILESGEWRFTPEKVCGSKNVKNDPQTELTLTDDSQPADQPSVEAVTEPVESSSSKRTYRRKER